MLKYFILTFLSINVFSQISTQQSSSNINWKEIENIHFKVVYPDYIEDQAQFTFNLLNYYQTKVSNTYKIRPKKLTVILRSELSIPNGFVTLGPRRTEWFTNSNITPLVGSLDWFQSLAIHEYRHVVQYDFLNRSNAKIGHYLFGDLGLSFLINMTMPSWYFEGDAVWTETALSNGGRGRSPRFSNRLKALLTSGTLPTYESFLAGDYSNRIPNLYVYGYFVITRAINIYGENFWKELAALATDSPLNPYTFYNAFYDLTQISFDSFFYKTLKELQTKWSKSKVLKPSSQFSEKNYPIENKDSLYFLMRDLDSFWTLHEQKSDGTQSKIKELNIAPSLSRVDVSDTSFVYNQNIVDSRYSFKSYSDLFLLDLKLQTQKRVTTNKRFYHPRFNNDGTKILAVEYTNKNEWQLVILDLNGKRLKVVKSKENYKISEAVWRNDQELLALTIQPNGMKQITYIDIQTSEFTYFTEPTRNNIYSLEFYEDELYFEADFKGTNNIFKLDLIGQTIWQCTKEEIGSYQPSIYNGRLSYVVEDSSGKKIKQKSIGCELSDQNIFKPKSYLSENSPSDRYLNIDTVNVENFKKLNLTKSKNSNYSETELSFTPHSWSFLLGRGYQASAQSRNYLNTINLSGTLGYSVEESSPYSSLSLTYSKFYPIINLNLRNVERRFDEIDSQWSEFASGINVILPYFKTDGLYNLSSSINLSSTYISISDRGFVVEDELNDENLIQNGIDFRFAWLKSLRFREVKPSYGFTFDLSFDDIITTKDSNSKSFLTTGKSSIYLPGINKNHNLVLSSTLEIRPENELKYQIQRNYLPTLNYNFSRGYSYRFTPKFTKYSIDYTLPTFYPNRGIKDWVYFNRIIANLFYDNTLSEFIDGEQTLISKGLELNFESLTFRKFNINYGLRFTHLEQNDDSTFEFFISM